jgi:hypothetical protein
MSNPKNNQIKQGYSSLSPIPTQVVSNEEFLKTTGGMALALLAMNQVFGRFFDIWPIEAAEPQAFREGGHL